MYFFMYCRILQIRLFRPKYRMFFMVVSRRSNMQQPHAVKSHAQTKAVWNLMPLPKSFSYKSCSDLSLLLQCKICTIVSLNCRTGLTQPKSQTLFRKKSLFSAGVYQNEFGIGTQQNLTILSEAKLIAAVPSMYCSPLSQMTLQSCSTSVSFSRAISLVLLKSFDLKKNQI